MVAIISAATPAHCCGLPRGSGTKDHRRRTTRLGRRGLRNGVAIVCRRGGAVPNSQSQKIVSRPSAIRAEADPVISVTPVPEPDALLGVPTLAPQVAEQTAVAQEGLAETCSWESSAAKAALALVRRVAKVGPDTPLEAIARRWPKTPNDILAARGLQVSANASGKGVGAPPRIRRIRFARGAAMVHEVVPYSEIYGLHPREFVFDRHSYIVPSGGQFGFVDLLAAERTGSSIEDEDKTNCDEEEQLNYSSGSDDSEWDEEEVCNTSLPKQDNKAILSLCLGIEDLKLNGEACPEHA